VNKSEYIIRHRGVQARNDKSSKSKRNYVITELALLNFLFHCIKHNYSAIFVQQKLCYRYGRYDYLYFTRNLVATRRKKVYNVTFSAFLARTTLRPGHLPSVRPLMPLYCCINSAALDIRRLCKTTLIHY